MTLRLGFVGYEAAKFACRAWHYSRSIPASRLVRIGVWEDERFIGVVLFSRGATKTIGSPYGLKQSEVCELTRVALDKHKAPVSQIISLALKMLKKHSPGLRLVVSYAAVEQGHHGGIYQAGNWIYEGPIDSYAIIIKGKKTHARTVSSRYGGNASLEWIRENIDPDAKRVPGLVRHKYLMPLDRKMRRQLRGRHRPYPKREAADGEEPEIAEDSEAER